ncbi:hypothetical protein AVEN_82832-1 [Araneus ventricosus]|uniref:Pre-C2HC domain-containing protein n=1 Tax=Araneus ventricosus TaxID=182803 RepID=A0A4Y2F5H9_ARAVE|nr:hypothetical protein AVEN_82832-1 [Araneus ventricosus]
MLDEAFEIVFPFTELTAESPLIPLKMKKKIIEFLNKNEKEHAVSEAPQTRPHKIVIKACDHSKEEISKELERNNFKIIRINQLRNFRLKTFYPIFLVEIAKTSNVNEIVKLEYISYLKVTVQQRFPTCGTRTQSW